MFDTLKYNLKYNRKSVMKNGTAWFLFGAIILVFVFWGMTPRNQSLGEGGGAATVNDSEISLYDYNQAVDQLRRDPRFEQLQALGGDAGRQMLQTQALSQLIEKELVNQETEKEHIWTTDAEVRDIILGIPQFNENGRFQREIYNGFLQNTNRTPAEFENEIRREQSLRRMVRLFSASLYPLAVEAKKMKDLAGIKADVEFVSVPTDRLIDPKSVSEGDVKAFVADAANATKIKDYFQNHRSEFSQPEKVKVRHILIRAKAGDDESEKAALAKIEGIAKEAKAGDFAKLAAKYSEDPGSKAKGGLIDYFAKGKMVPEFDDVAFSLPVGQISQPVKTQYGYHLIKVLDKKPATDRKFEDVKNEIAATLIARDRSNQAVETLQASLKKGDGNAVNGFVTAHKLKWDETGPFSINADTIPKMGPNDDILKTAFSLNAEKPLAPELFREGPRAFIVRYKAVPASAEKKAGAADDLESQADSVAGREGEEAIQEWLKDLRKNAKIVVNKQVTSR